LKTDFLFKILKNRFRSADRLQPKNIFVFYLFIIIYDFSLCKNKFDTDTDSTKSAVHVQLLAI